MVTTLPLGLPCGGPIEGGNVAACQDEDIRIDIYNAPAQLCTDYRRSRANKAMTSDLRHLRWPPGVSWTAGKLPFRS